MPSIMAPGKAGTRLAKIAALPLCSSTPSLPQRWETASPSSCPVCLAKAKPEPNDFSQRLCCVNNKLTNRVEKK